MRRNDRQMLQNLMDLDLSQNVVFQSRNQMRICGEILRRELTTNWDDEQKKTADVIEKTRSS